MNNKLIILLLTFFAIGCGSKTITEEATDKADNPAKPFSQGAVFDSLDSDQIRGLFGNYDYNRDMHGDSIRAGKLFTDVDLVLMYKRNVNQKEFKDLSSIDKLSNLEAFFFRDTLYLKLFKLTGAEFGVRIKIANGKFSTANYIVRQENHVDPLQPYTGKPYTEVENYIEPYYSTQHQMLFLNKESYALGDTITGYMIHEAMIGNDGGSIYSKGKFKGVIQDGIQQTLTKPKS
jgi:hypothetical protein